MGNEVGKVIENTGYVLTRAGGSVFEAVANANAILEVARDTFCKGSNDVVKNLVLNVTKRILRAMGDDLGNAAAIWEGIFTNEVNQKTIEFILDNKSELARFLVDLAEPAKLYAIANSTNGLPSAHNNHGQDNPYNELDLTSAMNRHAVICQLQRLAKSLSWILRMGRKGVTLEDLEMDTSLRSDFVVDENPADTATFTATAPEGPVLEGPQRQVSNKGEKWLFVNGIGGEYFWLKLYCERLRDTFHREITGIFNRGDGILWDLVECAGERNREQTLIQRTKSSREAQAKLKDELQSALTDTAKNGYVVMIAYSQGCLLLRLVLEDFLKTKDAKFKVVMHDRLRVITFGNPSVDWKVENVENGNLSKYVNHSEHFANKRDFVARLGVVAGDESYRDHKSSLTFINTKEDWIGHLFGTQYSLETGDYTNDTGAESKLLACAGGVPMGI